MPKEKFFIFNRNTQSGFLVQILAIVVLLIGLAAGIYLTQNKQIFSSRASFDSSNGLLHTTSDNIKTEDKYTITWTNVPNETIFDLIALFPKGAPDDLNYKAAFFTSSCIRYAGDKALKTGGCPIQALDLPTGDYEWRMFINSDLNKKIATLPIHISGTGSINTQPSGNSNPPTPNPQSVDLRPVTCTAANAGQTLEGGCTGSCGSCPAGQGQVAMFRCVPSNTGSVANQTGTICSSKCAQYCPISNSTPVPVNAQSTLTDYCPGGVCNLQSGAIGRCDVNGNQASLSVFWPHDSSAKAYLLRIDRDPDSWSGSYNMNLGDYITDTLPAYRRYTNTNDGSFTESEDKGIPGIYRFTVERNHNYKIWYHSALESGPYDGNMYKGRFSSRIDVGIITCH